MATELNETSFTAPRTEILRKTSALTRRVEFPVPVTIVGYGTVRHLYEVLWWPDGTIEYRTNYRPVPKPNHIHRALVWRYAPCSDTTSD